MKRKLHCLLIILIFSKFIFGQSNTDLEYYDSIKHNLQTMVNDLEISLVKTSFNNGNIKSITFTKENQLDSSGCPWLIGPSYIFYKNGQLKQYGYVDPITNVVESFTTYYYDEKTWLSTKYPDKSVNMVLIKEEKNDSFQYFNPQYYQQSNYSYKGDKIKSELILYLHYVSNKLKILKTVEKKFNYKKGITKIRERENGVINHRIEIMETK